VGIHPFGLGSQTSATAGDSNGHERDGDPDDAPETPLDEPPPPRVEDPPPQPADKGPYVVRHRAW